ncbi:hypothetical protein ACGFIW_01135 [Micromonospora sp. NPDC048935]|uniref:hypothetical protein n=1 Tax=Micromonospora sp. NPDC048935 TaxID=3364262 RepID=UPI00371C3555
MTYERTTTTTEDTPVYVTVANVCGVVAVVLLALFGFYFALYTSGELPTPTIGVTPLWTGLIGILGTVKAAQWVCDRSGDRTRCLIEERLAAVDAKLDLVSESALARAEESGRFKGIAATLRDAQQGDTGDLIQFSGRRRPS